MNGTQKPSLILQVLIVAFFFLFAIGSLIVFGYYAFLLFENIISQSDFIVFNKGSMYMFGVGLSSGLLTYFFIYEILKKKISASFNKKSTYIGLVFIGSIFIFPQLADYWIHKYINHIGYAYCPEQSYRWLHAQNLVFASDENICGSFNK